MSFLLYRRPDYVAKLPGPMSQSQCQLYVDRTQKHKRSIPPELSFDNIVQNKALPPCSLQDFMVDSNKPLKKNTTDIDIGLFDIHLS